jgi:hypothetical protein
MRVGIPILRFFSQAKPAWLLCGVLVFTGVSADETESLTSRYISIAIQGQLQPAHHLLSKLDSGHDTLADLELADQFRQRFIDKVDSAPADSGDERVDRVISAYRDYWARQLMDERTPDENERKLNAALKNIYINQFDMDSLENDSDIHAQLGTAIERLGYHYLSSPAPPLRDLFIWKTQDQKRYSVQLTDETRDVTVAFMSDLYSLGWKHFATLGLATTTGWVENEILYCVSWAYDLDSENFEVSYLKHEARHLSDLARFPDLQPTDLEYRAKLTELAFATTSLRRLLNDFTSKSASNPDSPHAMANYRATRELYRELNGMPFPDTGNPWFTFSGERINQAAASLLERNTTELLQ